MKKISLRPVQAVDESYLLALFSDSRQAERLQTTWNDDEWAEFMLFQFVAQNQDYTARYPDAKYDIILFDDEPVGRIWVGQNAEEIRLLDITIHSVVSEPRHRKLFDQTTAGRDGEK